MYNLYDHQKEALEKMHNGCILCGGVGSGKSRTALAFFDKVVCDHATRNIPLYIITTAKKRDDHDWDDEASYFLIGPWKESRVPYVCDSWNNIHKYTNVSGAFFIFDEQRVVGYGEWTKSFLEICKKNHWVLLSATPGDCWLDYMPVFVANGYYRNKTDFVHQHVVYSRYTKYPKVDQYVNVEKLIAIKNRVVVMMPFYRSTVSHPNLIWCEFDQHTFMRVYRGRWNVFENRPIKQASEWCSVMRKVVNADVSRIERLLDISNEHPRVIVFYNFDYELEILRDALFEYFLNTNVVISEHNGHRHEPVPTTDRWVYLVQYNSGSEAWNCTSTDTIVFYSLNYSYRIMLQASGRIDRANTPYTDLYYYVFTSQSTIDRSIITALKNKRKFNENKFYSKNVQTFEEKSEEEKAFEHDWGEQYFNRR